MRLPRDVSGNDLARRLLKRHVAIRILPPSLATDADRLGRFQREAEVLASLNHPHIAALVVLPGSADGDTRPRIQVVQHWTEELKRLVPAR